jgi:hypothetical protein
MRLPQPARRTISQRLAEEVDDLRSNLRADKDYVILFWNLYRNKDRLLEGLEHTYRTVTMSELLQLDASQISTVEAFYEAIDHFSLWVRQTEAMPASLERRYDRFLERLEPLHAAAMASLGGRPPSADRPTFPREWTSLSR